MNSCGANTPIVGGLQTLSLHRGTTVRYKFQRLDYNGDPILTRAEELYFIVKKRWTDTEAIITKDLSDMTFDSEGFYHFTIAPADTEGMAYGQYVWDITPVEDNNAYRAKPARGYLIVGNSAGWIINETED